MSSDPDFRPLKTDRLVLRSPRESDAALYRQLWTERDIRVPPHRRIDPEGHPTLAEVGDRIRSDLEKTPFGLLVLQRRAEADVIGYCGLVFTGDGAKDEPELAFELARAVHNLGYATEAGLAVITRAAEVGHRRLWAGVWEWNAASRRVLEKLGFRDTGRESPETEHGRSLMYRREL